MSENNKTDKPKKFVSVQKGAEKDLGENLGCIAFIFTFGLLCLVLPVAQIALPSQDGNRALNRWGNAGLIFGLPIVAFSICGSISTILSAKAARKKRLRKAFFGLIEQEDGQLSLLTFCQTTGISGEEAKAYLNEHATEFNATFELGEDGGICYSFVGNQAS